MTQTASNTNQKYMVILRDDSCGMSYVVQLADDSWAWNYESREMAQALIDRIVGSNCETCEQSYAVVAYDSSECALTAAARCGYVF